MSAPDRLAPDGGLTPEELRTKAALPGLLGAIARFKLRRHRSTMTPHPGPLDNEQSASAGKSGALRAGIFGVNDGLVSNLSLIMGVAGAGMDREVILLAGIAGMLAGAFSMGAGEYVSMRVQREVFERLLHLEAHELALEPEEEKEELATIFERKGLPPELAMQVSASLSRDPKVALETHAREELGLDPEDGLGSPWGAAISSFATFSFGAFVPLVTFLFTEGGGAVMISAVISGVTLFVVGALTSILTGKSFATAGTRMLAVGASAAVVTYWVGRLLDVTVTG
jgi:VIT1/CCC1 family predicted Fe2+/Mn2+ transporter